MPLSDLEKEEITRNQCHTCGKEFSTNSRLRRHEASHSRVRLHRCAFCDRTFNRQDSLRRHTRTCTIRGEHASESVLKRGRNATSCDLCRSKKLRCNSKYPCQRCFFSNVECAYTYLESIPTNESSDRSAADAVPIRPAATQPHNPGYNSLPFLLKYTDPSFKSITDAMAAAGARAEVVVDATQLCQPSVHVVGRELDSILTGFPLDFFPNHAADVSRPNFKPVALPQTHALRSRIEELHHDLQLQHAKSCTTEPSSADSFPIELAETVFNVESITDFVSAYFDYFHPHFAFIHRPTFSLEKATLPLLLAAALSGSVHLSPRDDALAARHFFDLGEEYVFDLLLQNVTNDSDMGDKTIEIVQAAQLIHALQNSSNDEHRRRRIQVKRHPELVASMRSLGLTKMRRRQQHEIAEWDQFIAEEMRIRLVAGIFVIDSMIMLLLNSRPQMTLTEMSSDLPCSEALFEAPTASDFVEIAAKMGPFPAQLPTLKDFVTLLLQESWPGPDDPSFASIDVKHLLIIILALHSMIFTARTALLLPSSSQALHRATARWKELWDLAQLKPKVGYTQTIGFAKNSLELWWLGLDLYLDQITKCNGHLKAVLATKPKELLYRRATELDDERTNGMTRGPLHGIRILLKDNIASAPDQGLPTTCGSKHAGASRLKAQGECVHHRSELPSSASNQAGLIRALNYKVTDDEYQETISYAREKCGTKGMDKVLEENDIDIIMGPGDGGMFAISGAAGYPAALLPLDYLDFNRRPFGLQIMAQAHQEAVLIQAQSAWEATFPSRQPPSLDEINHQHGD